MQELRRLPIRSLILFAFCVLPPITGFAQDCTDYSTHAFQVSNPLAPGEVPAVGVWDDYFLALDGTGVHLIDATDPFDLAIEHSRTGSYGDLAVGAGFAVLGSIGSVEIVSLPGLELLNSLPEDSGAPAVLAMRDALLAVEYGTHIFLYDLTDPAAPVPLHDFTPPGYDSDLGGDSLELSDRYLIRCSWGGNAFIGYHTSVTIIDVADPADPIVTQVIETYPDIDASYPAQFYSARAYGDGFVLEGLFNSRGERPDRSDWNNKRLSRITLDEDGIAQWQNHVASSGDDTHGFVLNGDLALWTGGTDQIVDLRNDTFAYSGYRFPGGPACWHPASRLLWTGVEIVFWPEWAAAEGSWSSYTSQTRVQRIDDSFAASLNWTYGDEHDPNHWTLKVVDLRDPSLPATGSCGGDYETVEHFAVIGRDIYFFAGSSGYSGMTRVSVAGDGSLSAPVTCVLPAPTTSLRWDDHDVVARADGSLAIYRAQDGADPLPVVELPGFGGECSLSRFGDWLLIHQDSSTRIVHLTDPENPSTTGTAGSNLLGHSRWDSQQQLLFVFNGADLAWYEGDDPYHLARAGVWTAPSGMTLVDIALSGDRMYASFGADGMGVYTFDRATGPAFVGGDYLMHPASLELLPSGALLPGPADDLIPLDCSDPLPVAVSLFVAAEVEGRVRLTWTSHLTDADSYFVVRRVHPAPTAIVARQPAHSGSFTVWDSPESAPSRLGYELWIEMADGRSQVIDALSLEPTGLPVQDLTLNVSPNPANPIARIDFGVPRSGLVRLDLYSLDGRRVAALVNGELQAGDHTRTWDGRDAAGRPVAAGTYLLRLEAGYSSSIRRVSFVK